MTSPSDLPSMPLATGTSLCGGQFTVLRYLAAGGFGITYLGRDALDRTVVIKECFPKGLIHRTGDTQVKALHAEDLPLFRKFTELFLKECRAIATLQHCNIVGVRTVFEENGTAYMVMDYVKSRNLWSIIAEDPGYLTPACVVDLAKQLLEAVRAVHEADMLHRDIKPENLLIDDEGRLVLIDFGAARKDMRTNSRKVSSVAVASDGYSPAEFYTPGLSQREDSDLYSVAATLYSVVTGQAPATAPARSIALHNDGVDPVIQLSGAFPDYTPAFLEAIDRSMSLKRSKRLQSAQEWLDMISSTPSVAPHPNSLAPSETVFLLRQDTREPESAPAEDNGYSPMPPDRDARRKRRPVLLGTSLVVALAAGAASALMMMMPDAPAQFMARLPDLADAARTMFDFDDDKTAAQDALCLGLAAPSGPDWSHRRVEGRILGRHASRVRSLAFLPDGSKLVSGSNDDTVRLWTLDSMTPPLVIEDHKGAVWRIAVSPRGDRFASASSDGTVRLRSLGGTLVQRFDIQRGIVPDVAFSCDGATLALETQQGTIQVWDVDNGSVVAEWRAHDGEHVNKIAFDPGSPERLITGGDDDRVRMWSVSGMALAELQRHDSDVETVSYDPTGHIVLSAGSDNMVRRRDLDSGEDMSLLFGHANWIGAMDVSPDGRFVATGSGDDTLRIWDMESGTQLHALTAPGTGAIHAVAFSPDGARIATGSNDGTVRIWHLP